VVHNAGKFVNLWPVRASLVYKSCGLAAVSTLLSSLLHTYLVGMSKIKTLVHLIGFAALHSADESGYESPTGASLAQFLLDCLWQPFFIDHTALRGVLRKKLHHHHHHHHLARRHAAIWLASKQTKARYDQRRARQRDFRQAPSMREQPHEQASVTELQRVADDLLIQAFVTSRVLQGHNHDVLMAPVHSALYSLSLWELWSYPA
jgi:hypothetical protein